MVSFFWGGVKGVFRRRTRLDVQRAGKILMNLMSGAAEEARTRNMETLSFKASFRKNYITITKNKRTRGLADKGKV